MRYLGIDGFRGGWVGAWIDARGGHGFDVTRRIAALLSLPHRRAMIDMPIGLPDRGQRECDLQARALVGASVFVGARRNLFAFADHAGANRHYWQHEGQGRGISLQLWNLRDKIAEVDRFITPERQASVGEAHPEMIFWRLAGGQRLPPKKSASGRAQRIELLTGLGFADLPQWLTRRRGTRIGADDLIDACACAVAARDSEQRLGGETDARGLRMEIND